MSNKMDVTISIVSDEQVHVLDRCLGLIYSGTEHNITFEIFVVNNDCGLETSNMLRKKYPQVKIIENTSRKGFSENHNQVIKKSSGEFILVMNPDIYVKKDFITRLLAVMRSDNKIGVCMGKLLRYQPDNVIDSTGHIIFRDRRTLDRGQGEIDSGQYDRQEEIFSASGAAMMCRREMLEDVKLRGEYFDGSFKLYKEELDLCWRARLRGWKIVYSPDAVANHLRGWGTDKQRKNIPVWIRRESYKNRYLVLIKDDHFVNFAKDLPFILFNEAKVFLYVIFREPRLIAAWFQILWLLPTTLIKRREIMKKALVGPGEIRKWFK